MFRLSGQQKAMNHCVGKVWSLEGNIYVAFCETNDGRIVEQSSSAFRSCELAKDWLKQRGVERVTVAQSPAYFEMIGSTQ